MAITNNIIKIGFGDGIFGLLLKFILSSFVRSTAPNKVLPKAGDSRLINLL